MSETTYPDGAHWSRVLDCGHTPTPPTHFHTTGVPLTSGLAVMPDGRVVCYACADDSQRAALASTSGPVSAYVSARGDALTTWAGGRLAVVTAHGHSARAGFGRGLHYWTFRTPDGRYWHGTNGGPGMAVTIHLYVNQEG